MSDIDRDEEVRAIVRYRWITVERLDAAAERSARQQAAQRSLDARWQVTYQRPQDFQLSLSQGPNYRITPLTENAP